MVVTIPDNPQWKQIRRTWGDPDYLVAAVEYPQSGRIIHCLDELEIHVDVIVKGVHVPLKPAQGMALRLFGYISAFRSRVTCCAGQRHHNPRNLASAPYAHR